jgi:hypothetical protein
LDKDKQESLTPERHNASTPPVKLTSSGNESENEQIEQSQTNFTSECPTYLHNNYSHNPFRETFFLSTNGNTNTTFVPVESAFKVAVLREA